jgi:hypothetical protein
MALMLFSRYLDFPSPSIFRHRIAFVGLTFGNISKKIFFHDLAVNQQYIKLFWQL